MAKKKTAETANIKAGPVLRAQSEDPTPETPVITKSYSVRDDWKDKGVVNYVAFKSVDGEVQDLTVNGEPAGGGGGGFPTITVSVEGDPDADFELYISSGLISGDNINALYKDEGSYTIGDPSFYPGMSGEFVVVTAPLYLIANVNGEAAFTTSGDVSYNPGDEPYYTITGNCKFIVS